MGHKNIWRCFHENFTLLTAIAVSAAYSPNRLHILRQPFFITSLERHNYFSVEHSARKKKFLVHSLALKIKQDGLAKACHHQRAPLHSPQCVVQRALLAARGQAEPQHPFCPLYCNFSCQTKAYEERRTPATGGQGPAANGLGSSARLWVLAAPSLHLEQPQLPALLWRQCQGHQQQHVADPTSQVPSWGLMGVTLPLAFKGYSFTHWARRCNQTSYWFRKLQ